MKGQGYTLFAQEPGASPPIARQDPKNAIKSETLWITVGLLALALVVGAIVLAVVDRWRKRTTPFDKASIEEVSNFREMYESGEITQSEYERIRNKMSAKVRETVGVKPPSDSTSPPSAKDGIGPGTSDGPAGDKPA